MRKKIYFYLAVFWTFLILYFCLKNASEFKKIEFPNIDKLIHFSFHFVFTFLWFLYLKKKFKKINNYKLLLFLIISSLLFGSIIELMQQKLTTSRSAEFMDVLANFLGTFLASVSILIVKAINKRFKNTKATIEI